MQTIDTTDISSKLHLLQAHHLVLLSERMKQVDIAMHTLSGRAVSEQVLATLKDVVHQIAGSSGIYGFHDVSAAALALNDFLKNTPSPLPDVLAQKITEFKSIYLKEIEGLSSTKPQSLAFDKQQTAEQGKPLLPIIGVIDDDPAVILAYQIILGDIAQLAVGRNSADALSIMQKVNPAVMFLDDIMPGGQTGLSFLESIKHHPSLSKIPVVMVTASCDTKDVMRGLSAGSVDYITKPFHPNRLLEITNNVLSRKPQQVLLAIADHCLYRDLSNRLSQLGCDIVSADTDPNGLSHSLIVVTDGLLMPDAELLSLLSLASGRTALYIGEPDETLSQTDQVIFFEKAGIDLIIPEIGKLIAARRKSQQAIRR